MDPITALVTIVASFVGGLGLLGAAAFRWGIDTRPSIGDDHAR
jgi:hypothetical protein